MHTPYTILCVKWGKKYDADYVLNLKSQIDKNFDLPYNFYCLTDNPETEYDIQLPTYWDDCYDPERNFFWAYRKCYMFNENFSLKMDGGYFLYLDLDILIHQNIEYFFKLDMNKPYIVRGWWNDIDNCRRNFGQVKSTPLNSSVIRWNRSQLRGIWDHIDGHKEVIFFTYKTIDNYLNHHFYNVWDEKVSFFNTYPKGDIYSWYKGNIFPEDMALKKIRSDHKICLFNNSTKDTYEDMFEIEELRKVW
ncbi:uncharacterized protein METZ01_LOCUS130650 [marine metagenome]|uniref:Nucleotide-diphospho-sugar transferase domain-containing protein n=1 Tax=marine metagenome TaxID=408172 RepID=A0A381YL56_9ZZZZ